MVAETPRLPAKCWTSATVRTIAPINSMQAAYTEERGQPPYDPRMMTVLLLYASSQGVSSSQQIERRCGEDLAFM